MPHSENSRQTQPKRTLNSLRIAEPEHEEQSKKQNEKHGKTSHEK